MSFAENLQQIRGRIDAACLKAKRDPAGVLLLPVSKSQPVDAIREASAAGLQIFGENKVQEAKAKIPLCSSRLQWHMIGHLQSNKCRDAVRLFQMIQSIDSLPLAEELNQWAEKLSKRMPILLEVNVAGEGTKFGYRADQLISEIKTLNELPRLEIHGLMTIAPYSSLSEKARPYFQELARLREQCSDLLGAPLPHLSMGMSGDFEVAVEEGATIIRIGTALFGPRKSAALKTTLD